MDMTEHNEIKLSTPRPLSDRGIYALAPTVINQFAGGTKAMQALRDVGADIDVASIGKTGYDRRIAVLDDPDILCTMVERGWARASLAAVFGLPNVVAFNKWLRNNKLDDLVKESEVASADFFADVAAESYAGLDTLQDNINEVLSYVAVLSRAAQGDQQSINEVADTIQAATEDEEQPINLHMVISARLHHAETAVGIMAKGADAVTKIADRRYKAAFQLAATRNPGRFGGASSAAPMAGSGQSVTMNLNFGGGDTSSMKMVNSVPEVSSLPLGLDFG